MDKAFGVAGVTAAFFAGYAIAFATEPGGTDIWLILGALCALVSVVALAAAALLDHLQNKPKERKEAIR